MATKTLRDIPVASGATLMGHAGAFKNDRLNFLLRVQRETGDIGQVRMLNTPVLIVSSPELLHEMLVEKARFFAKSPGIRMALYTFAGEGLFTSDGDLWKRQRKLMAPLFQPSYMANYVEGMRESIARGTGEWREGEIIDVAREMTRITMSIVGKALFDSDTFSESDELGAAVSELFLYISEQAGSLGLIAGMQIVDHLERLENRLPPALEPLRIKILHHLMSISPLPTPRATRARSAQRRLEALVQKMITERRAAGLSRKDLLTKLLAARDEDDGQTMSDKQVRDEVMTLFLAGHETTAVGSTWAIHLLSQHPDAYRRHKEEVDALGGKPPTFRDLERLPYTLRVFKEALRLYPPAFMLDRVALTDVEIGGYAIPEGTVLFFSPYMTHRRPDLWPDPERFDPDRFTPEKEAARPRLAYFPFGAGPRICIGSHFALIEGHLLLAHIAQRAVLTPTSNGPVLPGVDSALRPNRPLRMRVHLNSGPATAAA